MRILVGCPLVGGPAADRSWILPHWYQHLTDSVLPENVELDFIMTVHPDDEESLGTLEGLGLSAAVRLSSLVGEDGDHRWSKSRYHQMVALRNELLVEVRQESPDYFFSLDSDVLLHPQAISSILGAFEEHETAWAVGAKCYVSNHGVAHPNMGKWLHKNSIGGRYVRQNLRRLTKVDILICCYMMNPNAYRIDYVYHPQGEDLGWSIEVANAGGNLFWDGRYANKHVMTRSRLYEIDARVGF